MHHYKTMMNNLNLKSSNSVVTGLINNLVEYLELVISNTPESQK